MTDAKPGGLVRKLTSGAAIVLGIKIAGAAAAFVMFALLARAMDATEYGAFSAGFSLATLLAQVALLGQSLLILRELPRVDAPRLAGQGRAQVQAGYLRVGIGTGVIVIALALAGAVLPGGEAPYLLGAAALIPAFVLAEYQMNWLRGRGMITLAIAPREIIWRLMVMALAGAGIAGLVPLGTGNGALIAVAALLGLLMLAQSFLDRPTWPWTRASAPIRLLDQSRASAGLWFTSVIMIAVPNLSVLMVGLILSLEDAAVFFAAFKTAQTLKLFPTSLVTIGAPMLSKAFHDGNMRRVQKICRLLSVIATAAIVVVYGALVVLGPWLLGFFGPDFARGYAVLLIMAGGYLASGIAGPTRAVMLMSDNQGALNRIILVTNITAIALLPLAAWLGGMVGVALVFALAVGGWNIWVWGWIRAKIGIETSILGLVIRPTHAP